MGTRTVRRWMDRRPLDAPRSDRVSRIVVALAMALVLGASLAAWAASLAVDSANVEPLKATVEAVTAESRAVTNGFLADAELAARVVERVLDTDPMPSNQELRRTMQLLVSEHEAIDGIFVGYANGDFLHVAKGLATNPSSLRMTLITDADLGTREVLDSQLDADLTVVSDNIRVADLFDPRERPWYIAAQQQETGWTDPYVFASSSEPGITHFRRHAEFAQNGIVVGVDMRLAEVTEFLSARQPGPNGGAAIVSAGGAIVAGENPASSAFLDTAAATTKASNDILTTVTSVEDGQDRLVTARTAVGQDGAWALVVSATESDFSDRLNGQVDRIRTAIPLATLGLIALVTALTAVALARIKRLARKATIDAETGLATRVEAHAALDRLVQSELPVLVLTTAVGHRDIGAALAPDKRVLAAVGEALREFATSSGLAGRIGSREFIVARPVEPTERPAGLVTDLYRELRAVGHGNRRRPLTRDTPVIGWELIDPAVHERTLDSVLRDLDLALLTAEAGSRPVVEYSDELQPAVLADERTRLELTEAIDSGEFITYFQPEIDLQTGEVVGAEALMRRHLPNGEIESATPFIADLERLGMLSSLTHSVLDETTDFAMRWRALRSFTIRINLAASELNSPSVMARLGGLTDLTDHQWCIELTERTIGSLTDATVERLQDLAGAGVGIALDDFGTGYSSMAELKRLPITALKIDRTFVEPLTIGSGKSVSIAALIRNVADSLDLELIAEGIETETQRRALVDLGCKRGQGWLMAPALSANEFVTWTRQRLASLEPLVPTAVADGVTTSPGGPDS